MHDGYGGTLSEPSMKEPDEAEMEQFLGQLKGPTLYEVAADAIEALDDLLEDAKNPRRNNLKEQLPHYREELAYLRQALKETGVELFG